MVYNVPVNTQDAFYTLLIVGIITIIVCAIYTTYYLVKALRAITNFLNDLEGAAQTVKDGLTIRALAAVPAILLALASKLIRKRR